MGANYYYLVSSLPTLEFGEFANVPIEALFEKILSNLIPGDLKLIAYLRKTRDIQNLLSIGENWHTFREMGNIPIKAFKDPDIDLGLPEDWDRYVLSQKSEKTIPIDWVWLNYFEEGLQIDNNFVRTWSRHELALWAILAIIRREGYENAQSSDLSLEELEKNENQLIQEILLSSRLPDFGLGHEYDWAYSIREIYETTNPKELELALDKIRWNFIDNLIANRYFSHEVVIGYVLKLFICERWQRLDKKQGKNRLESILGGKSGE